MTPAPTTIPVVKNFLVALFKSVTENEATEVWSSRTAEEHQAEENVYIGRVRGRRNYKTWPVLAPHSREEDYTVTVEVEVYRAGTDDEGTEARMWAIVALLEKALAERPNLEERTQWNISTDFEQATAADASGVLAKYSFGVAVVARI